MKTIKANLLFALLALFSCKKEAGVGGDASISGLVWVKDYNATFTQLIAEYPAEDVYVYIKYSDHEGFDDRVKTDYNGKFRFEFLYPGEYEIYTYSKDSTLTDANNLVPVIAKAKVEGRKEKADIGVLSIFD